MGHHGRRLGFGGHHGGDRSGHHGGYRSGHHGGGFGGFGGGHHGDGYGYGYPSRRRGLVRRLIAALLAGRRGHH